MSDDVKHYVIKGSGPPVVIPALVPHQGPPTKLMPRIEGTVALWMLDARPRNRRGTLRTDFGARWL